MKHIELFKNGFDSTVSEKIQPENWPYIGYSLTEGKLAFTVVPNEEGTMYTIYRVVSKDISNCTYNMVDLGLSVKWADRNVGASSPEHYGSYFQWGDTKAYTFDGVGEITAAEMASLLQPIVGNEMEVTKDNVGEILEMMDITSTNLTLEGLGGSLDKLFNFDSYFDTTDGGSTFNKYNNNGGLTVLEPIDDAATTHMGSQYRIPTFTEIQELISGTTQTFIDLDGTEYSKEQVENDAIEYGKLKGVRFTGLNGNSIFVPAAGFCHESFLNGVTVEGNLWSSSLSDGDDSNVGGLSFYHDGYVNYSSIFRGGGQSVRGVQV